MSDTVKQPDSEGWLHRNFHAARHRPHFSIAAALFIVLAATTIGGGFGLARGMLIAFDVSAGIFLATIVRMFTLSPVATIRARVAQQDAGRWGVLWGSVVVSAVAVVSIGVELRASHAGGVAELLLGAASIVLSWCFLNAMFGLHYAHEYYMRASDKALQFPGDTEPDYWDFMYFAFVLGMTFQVSDVQILRPQVRRIALVHGIIAFFFDVFILALSVNVVAVKV